MLVFRDPHLHKTQFGEVSASTTAGITLPRKGGIPGLAFRLMIPPRSNSSRAAGRNTLYIHFCLCWSIFWWIHLRPPHPPVPSPQLRPVWGSLGCFSTNICQQRWILWSWGSKKMWDHWATCPWWPLMMGLQHKWGKMSGGAAQRRRKVHTWRRPVWWMSRTNEQLSLWRSASFLQIALKVCPEGFDVKQKWGSVERSEDRATHTHKPKLNVKWSNPCVSGWDAAWGFAPKDTLQVWRRCEEDVGA